MENCINTCVNSGVVDLGIPQNATNVEVECYGANTTNEVKSSGVDYNAQYIESLKTEIQNLEAQVKCKESEVDMVKELSGKVSEDYMNLYCLHYGVSKEDFIQKIADNVSKIFNQGR